MGKFKKITVDISNVCNAKCKWCTTGRRNRIKPTEPHYMSQDLFRRILDYCIGNDIIEEKADVELYSWGEPFLNPDILNMLDLLVERKMPFNLSTNGAVGGILKREHVEGITFLMFSLSGFSQKTYGKIHGLNLKNVLSNIRMMVEPFREMGMLDKVEINFHVYQFNIGEVGLCAEFCRELGIRFVPRYAYLADWDLCNGYLTNQLNKDDMKEVSKDLFCHYYDQLLEECPDGYICPQMDRLFIDSCGNVLSCAWAVDDILGDIFEMSYKEIAEKKAGYYRCKECLESGQAYIIQQYTQFLSEYDEAVEDGLQYYGEKITPSLYYKEEGEEYSEERKIKKACVIRKNGQFLVHFHLPENQTINQIRFDPCEYPCKLVNLEILCNGKKRMYEPYNAVINKNGFMKFETDDPCIICDINNESKDVVIQGIIQ